jgi:hypothetical protein
LTQLHLPLFVKMAEHTKPSHCTPPLTTSTFSPGCISQQPQLPWIEWEKETYASWVWKLCYEQTQNITKKCIYLITQRILYK